MASFKTKVKINLA